MSRRRLLSLTNLPATSIAAVDIVEVSMLCHDGSDSKNGQIQISAIGADASNLTNYCQWTSSSDSTATVVNGLVRSVSGGTGDVTITATFKGVSFTCVVTVYASMPDVTTRYTLKGGKGSNLTGAGDTTLCEFGTSNNSISYLFTNIRVIAKAYAPSNYTYFANTVFGGDVSSGIATYGFSQISGNRVAVASVSRSSATQFSIAGARIGSALTVGTKYSVDFGKTSEGYRSAGVTYSTPAATWTEGPYTYNGASVFTLAFSRTLEKTVLFSVNRASVTEASLSDRTVSDVLWIPQNYIRYRNVSGKSNPTRIFNIGTLGSVMDATLDNTPSGWF